MIVKPGARIVQVFEAKSFSVVANPGVNGFGAAAMRAFADALTAADGDFVVAVGDVTVTDREQFVRYIGDFVDRLTDRPVHMLPGGGEALPLFEERFGFANRAVVAEDFALVMLDNSSGEFSDEALEFLRETLAVVDNGNIVVSFHLPPPNRFSGLSLSAPEWERFEDAVGVWRKRIGYLVAGQGGCCFEDEINGLRLLAIGSGNSADRPLEKTAPERERIAEFVIGNDGCIAGTLVPVRIEDGRVRRLPEIAKFLETSFGRECGAHADRLLEAEAADRIGFHHLARLLRASAASHLRRALNLRLVSGRTADPRVAAIGYAETPPDPEGEETTAAADMATDLSAAHVLRMNSAAERSESILFRRAAEALEGDLDAESTRYQICSSCGFFFAGHDAPFRCPECAAPAERFREI